MTLNRSKGESSDEPEIIEVREKRKNQNLVTVESRKRLPPRRTPYWHKLASGRQLGFRKMSESTEGTWIARSYSSDTKKQSDHPLGSFADYPPNQRFNQAKVAAEKWFEHLGLGGRKKPLTVKEACAAYVQAKRGDQDEKGAKDAEGRFRRWVDSAPIGDVQLHKLTKAHCDAWRRDVLQEPVTDFSTDEPEERARAKATVNRDMTVLRAALNKARADGHVMSDFAWKEALKPIEDADNPRDLYLDRNERDAWISKAPDDVALLLAGNSCVPVRPGALAAMQVADFDPKVGHIRIGLDKKSRPRWVQLPPESIKLLKIACAKKARDAPLFTQSNGTAWNRHAWQPKVKAAALAAGLTEEVVLYIMRHSVITDLVNGGLDLFTVSKISGTSVEMIERTYGHLQQDRAVAALAKLVLPQVTSDRWAASPAKAASQQGSVHGGSGDLQPSARPE